MKTFVLDTCALIAYIKREKGSAWIENYLKDKNSRFIMHAVNFYEVYYNFLKFNCPSPDFIYDLADKIQLKISSRFDRHLISESARLKACYSMSLADSIACGLAIRLNATLLTTDHHELDEVAEARLVKIKFIR